MAKTQEIPNKLYFRIGEVSDIVGVKPYVLRYWESEFPDIKPSKSKSGQRLYKRRDVELLVGIKRLLYDERFTIDGARKRLKEAVRGESAKSSEVHSVPHSKQLDVFAEQDVTLDEVPRASESSSETKAGSGVDKKVFTKLKKDLESLLLMIRE